MVAVALLLGCATNRSPRDIPERSLDIQLAEGKPRLMFNQIRAQTSNRYGSEDAELYINYSFSSVNAVTWDDGSIVLYRGLLMYVQSEDELAGVIAHEYCHILNGDLGTGRQLTSKQIEQEADVCGVKLAVKAGYDCNKMANIWLRYAKDYPGFSSESHPTPIERYHYMKEMCQ